MNIHYSTFLYIFGLIFHLNKFIIKVQNGTQGAEENWIFVFLFFCFIRIKPSFLRQKFIIVEKNVYVYFNQKQSTLR